MGSRRLGLSGKADVVELLPAESAGRLKSGLPEAVRLPGLVGHWTPVPIEYKRGKPKRDDSDRVQLCAQGLCLEEALQVRVPAGKLFYGLHRRRFDVPFDEALRHRAEEIARRFHELVASGRTPLVYREPKCKRCSLLEVCLPPKSPGMRSVSAYLVREVWTRNAAEEED